MDGMVAWYSGDVPSLTSSNTTVFGALGTATLASGTGTVAATLSGVTVAAVGVNPRSGTVAATLSAFSAAAVGATARTATAAGTLGAIAVSANNLVPISGGRKRSGGVVGVGRMMLR